MGVPMVDEDGHRGERGRNQTQSTDSKRGIEPRAGGARQCQANQAKGRTECHYFTSLFGYLLAEKRDITDNGEFERGSGQCQANDGKDESLI